MSRSASLVLRRLGPVQVRAFPEALKRSSNRNIPQQAAISQPHLFRLVPRQANAAPFRPHHLAASTERRGSIPWPRHCVRSRPCRRSQGLTKRRGPFRPRLEQHSKIPRSWAETRTRLRHRTCLQGDPQCIVQVALDASSSESGPSSMAAATRPAFSRTRFSTLCATSRFSARKRLAFSRPWPIR